MVPEAAPPRGGEGRETNASQCAGAATDPRRPLQETTESPLSHRPLTKVDVGGEPG